MRKADGWSGALPITPARAGGAAAALLAGALLAALLATLVGWPALLLAAAALVAGIGIGASGFLDRDGFPAAMRAASLARLPDTSPAATPGATPGVAVGVATGVAAGGPGSVDAPGGAGAEPPAPQAAPAGATDRTADRTADAEEVIRLLAEGLGATRVTVWSRSAGAPDAELEPRLSSGRLPPSLPGRGEPLVWSLEQDQPMRLDDPPPWARGPLLAVPFDVGDGPALLTVEVDGGAGEAREAREAGVVETTEAGPPSGLPGVPEAGRAAAILRVVLGLGRREAGLRAAQERFDRVLEFLRDVPRDPGGGKFPDGLAEAAMAVTGGLGAAVASWRGESGQVLACRGSAGGPVAGTWFGVMEGDLALAARAGTTLQRDRREGRSLPLAGAGEQWLRRPRYTAVVPLRNAADDSSGLVAVWGDAPPAPEGLDLLFALGPLLALQLDQAVHLDRFRQQATEDALTGLANRGALEERVELERRRFHRYRRPLALLVLDLDHFKRINDTYGHPAGDAVLARVADILRTETRETDFPARYGGEELVVLMEETLRAQAADTAERIRRAIAGATIQWNGVDIPVTASIGVSACPECVDDPAGLMRTADAALYASKEGGRNRVTSAPISGSES